jgi:hypothetical protein
VLSTAGTIDRLSLSTRRVKVFMAIEYWRHAMDSVKVASVRYIHSFGQLQDSLDRNAHVFLPHTNSIELSTTREATRC